MGSKLLVRSYNVGCGDCIYVRIPNNDDHFHIIIDCGSKEGANTGVMKRAIKDIEDNLLPVGDTPGKKRLDLIVVTHRHEDHIKGFNPKFFNNIEIKNIWITAAMDETHKQAESSHSLYGFALKSMKELVKSKASLSPELHDLVALYGINNKNATEALTKTLPNKNGIDPLYVYAGKTSDDYGISIKNTKIKILAPEENIDYYYLGEEAAENYHGMIGIADDFRGQSKPIKRASPTNITEREFRTLQSRMLSNALAFAVDDSKIQNNVSTVLLIEWGKKRLLFVGDAEWEEEFREGKRNGSWNVMWKKRKKHLSKPINFLKVGHHGSQNATPWNRYEEPDQEVNQIFNSILPLPGAGKKPTAACLVSTKRKQYTTIPDAELMVELGKRVCNTKSYLADFQDADSNFDPDRDIFNYSVVKEYSTEPSPREVGDKGWLDKAQPFRTDMDSDGKSQKKMLNIVEFVEVTIDPD